MIPKNPQSKRTTDALVKAARKRVILATRSRREFADSTKTLSHLMTARYGDQYRLPFGLQFTFDNGADNPEALTLETLDAAMTAFGYPPLKP